MVDPLGIPEFLKIPAEERRAAWEKFRAEHKPLPPERKSYTPLGATDDRDSNDA